MLINECLDGAYMLVSRGYMRHKNRLDAQMPLELECRHVEGREDKQQVRLLLEQIREYRAQSCVHLLGGGMGNQE